MSVTLTTLGEIRRAVLSDPWGDVLQVDDGCDGDLVLTLNGAFQFAAAFDELMQALEFVTWGGVSRDAL